MPFSGFQDFNPDFSNALQQLIAARPGISINSGYRTNERQAQLFAQKLAEMGGNVAAARRMVAPPIGLYGSKGSRHTHGIAADLAFATDADKAWAHENAQRYGLNFRMGHEPWHIELVGGKPTAVNQEGAPVKDPQPEAQVEAPEERDKLDFEIPGPKLTLQTAPVDPNSMQLPPPQDVNALANLLSPNRQSRDSNSQQILKRIRGYG